MARKPKGLPAGTVVDGRVICGAQNRRGEPCTQDPIKGQKRCRFHGGVLNPVIIKEREIRAKINGELQSRGWEPVTDPLAALADIAGEILEFKELCRAQINNLEGWVGYNQDEEEFARALVLSYERSLDRSGKILLDMSRLGLDAAALNAARERPTREQAATLANVIDRVLAALNLTSVQKDRVPDAIEAALVAEGLL